MLSHFLSPHPLWHFEPITGHGLPLWGFTIKLRHTTLSRTPLEEWSARPYRPLPDNTQHSQKKNIHASGRIRTGRIPSKQAAVDPCLRPRGQWERRHILFISNKCLLPNWWRTWIHDIWQHNLNIWADKNSEGHDL